MDKIAIKTKKAKELLTKANKSVLKNRIDFFKQLNKLQEKTNQYSNTWIIADSGSNFPSINSIKYGKLE